MAPRPTTPDSSDDEAPETFSFGVSKKAAKGAQDALQQFATTEQQKRKQKNRERDYVLKERAAHAKGKTRASTEGQVKASTKGKAKVGLDSDEDGEEADSAEGRDELQTRMERAMREAEEEDSDDALMEDGEGMSSDEETDSDEAADPETDDDNEAFLGKLGGDDSADTEDSADEDGNDDEEDSDGYENKDETMDYEEEESDERIVSSVPRPDYLPDHYFQSTLANVAQRKPPRNASSSTKPPPKKRKRVKRSSKDIVLGSRTIRTLPSTSQTVPSTAHRRLVPPARVNTFVKRTLNLKGRTADAKAKGWERRAANVGVMKRSGPAASFVRNR